MVYPYFSNDMREIVFFVARWEKLLLLWNEIHKAVVATQMTPLIQIVYCDSIWWIGIRNYAQRPKLHFWCLNYYLMALFIAKDHFNSGYEWKSWTVGFAQYQVWTRAHIESHTMPLNLTAHLSIVLAVYKPHIFQISPFDVIGPLP